MCAPDLREGTQALPYTQFREFFIDGSLANDPEGDTLLCFPISTFRYILLSVF
jgi:hypothetical protein